MYENTLVKLLFKHNERNFEQPLVSKGNFIN